MNNNNSNDRVIHPKGMPFWNWTSLDLNCIVLIYEISTPIITSLSQLDLKIYSDQVFIGFASKIEVSFVEL